MAEGVVSFFEVVDIVYQQGQFPPISQGALDFTRALPDEATSVWYLGQVIGVGLFLEFLSHAFKLGYRQPKPPKHKQTAEGGNST